MKRALPLGLFMAAFPFVGACGSVSDADTSSPDSDLASADSDDPATSPTDGDDAASVADDETAASDLDTTDADGLPGSDPDASTAWTYPARAVCTGTYGSPTASNKIRDTDLREASGLAASPQNPGVVWTHNDSGGSARLFAIGVDGAALGRLKLDGLPGGDWEDVAAAACPDQSGPCVWVEDRSSHKVYAVVEPVVSPSAPLGDVSTSDFWTFQTTYPGGLLPDVEALLVEPDGSAFYLIEKVKDDRTRIFSGVTPLARVADVGLTEAGSFASPETLSLKRNITGGDLHPSRTRLLLRTYFGIYEYRLAPGDFPSNLDAAQRIDIAVPVSLEPAAEAVTYDHSGTGLLTVSEGILGIPNQPLHHFACQ